MIKKSIMFFCLALLVCAAPAGQAAYSQSLEDAIGNYQNGKYNKAERQWQDLAEAGDADALFNLGQMYHLGKGTVFDDNKAADYYLAAANLGHTAAARELGNLYFFSPGVNGGKQAAVNWWARAASAGDGQAQYILGILYFNGDGVDQDLALGFAWTLLAVDAGIMEAIQSETAMRGQLTEKQLQASQALARTLMTESPSQAPAPLLVGEAAQKPRSIPVTAKTVQVKLARPETAPVRLEDQPILEVEEMVLQEDPGVPILVESSPEEEAQAEPMETVDPLLEAYPEEQGINETEKLAEQTDELSETHEVLNGLIEETVPPQMDELSETLEVLNGLIEETVPASPEIVPESEYDLGNPLSPLVSDSNFSPAWSVQLTSFRKPENAEAHWQEVSENYPGLFEDVEKRIVRFDLGPERGIYYRLRVGPFMDKAEADLKCLEIQEAGLDCLVIWP